MLNFLFPLTEQFVRELKNLKLDLLSDLPRERKVQTPPPDPEEVERRLLLETIELVSGLGPVIEVDAIENEVNDQEEIFDVLEKMKATFKGFTGFKDKTVEDPSLQRDCIQEASNFPGPSSISMPEVIPTDLDLNNLNREDAFGEATAEDIADAGLFAGPLGRPLYEGLKNRETMFDISRRAAQSMTPLNHKTPEIFVNGSPEFPNPRRTTLGVPVPPVELTDQSMLNELPPALLATYPDVFIEDGPPQPQAAVIDQTVSPPRESKRMSRREYFENAANVNEGEVFQKLKKRRRRRLNRRSPSLEDREFLELNGLLVRHNRKQKAIRASRPKVQPSISMDIFENLEDYESDEIFEVEVEAEQETRPVLPPLLEDELFVVPETLQYQSMTPTAPEVLLLPNADNSESFVPKRRRIDLLETDELREIIGFEDNLLPPLPTPRQSTTNVESFSDPSSLKTPFGAFKPPKVSTVRVDGIQKITLDDIEFGRLRNVSDLNLQGNNSLDVETIASYLGRSKSAIGDAVASARGAAETSSNVHRQPDDSLEFRRFVKDGENWIAYEGHGGRTERYTEYNLEVRFRRLSDSIH